MVVLEDFTRISEGCEIPDAGHVKRCPRCGRPGVEEPSEQGTPLFVHVQISEVIGDGMRVELQDCCALTSLELTRDLRVRRTGTAGSHLEPLDRA